MSIIFVYISNHLHIQQISYILHIAIEVGAMVLTSEDRSCMKVVVLEYHSSY